MSFFRRSKYKEFLETIKSDGIPPKVIKKSKIKPTKCCACLSIYQANHNHIKSEKDIGYILPKYNLFTQCPICLNSNRVEFVEDTKNDEIMLPCKVGDLLYMPWKWNGQKGVACLKVTTITNILDFGWNCGTDFNTDDDEYAEEYNYGRFTVEDFGKTVFLTQKEAEQALKEVQK